MMNQKDIFSILSNIAKISIIFAMILAFFSTSLDASAWDYYGGGMIYPGPEYYYRVTPPPPPPPPPAVYPTLDVSCSPSASGVYTGDTVVWTAYASGGRGSYYYTWSGTDGLSGSASYVLSNYYYPGTKTASVTVSSGNQTVTRSCSSAVTVQERVVYRYDPPPIYYNPPVVYYPQYQTLSISCAPNNYSAGMGDVISWSAYPSGGTGSYSYSWSGTDGLSGSGPNVYKQYYSSGAKYAFVTVYSGGQSATSACSREVFISQTYQHAEQPLSVSCYVNLSQAAIGKIIEWRATAAGGSGYYSYNWSGTDGVSGTGQIFKTAYDSLGRKNVNVIVYSGNQNASAWCGNSVVISNSAPAPAKKPAAKTTSQPPVSKPIVSAPKPVAIVSNLDGSCRANLNSAKIGDEVSWEALAWGGTGAYSFKWSGTDGLSGAGGKTIMRYDLSGNKMGRVIISSNGNSIERFCEGVVAVENGGEMKLLGSSAYSFLGIFGVLAIIALLLIAALIFLLYKRTTMK